MVRRRPSPAVTTMPVVLVVVVFVGVVVGGASASAGPLKAHYYRHVCPAAEAVVRDIVTARVAADPTALPAKLLRLFFHDCFVRVRVRRVGADRHGGRERRGGGGGTRTRGRTGRWGGYDVIETGKGGLEGGCPGVVSWAEIVAFAARNAVSYQVKPSHYSLSSPAPTPASIVDAFSPCVQFGRDLWDVQLGRRDGVVSLASEALANLPAPSDNFTTLESNFAGKGLDVKDLVILSGAHTIGVGHCNLFGARLFNFTGAAAPSADPSLNAAYAAQLRATCGSPSNNATAVPMDPGSPARFDAHYFVNLKLGRGLFASDAALLADRRAAALVHGLTDQDYFLREFKNAVRKMGRVGVLTGDQGEIRKNCRAINGK
ncbi:hypothetical protein OsI_38572 [Oryza sativa Indica Group]|uniref:Peroxidase n=1 Tax=Oryza sativa subsp. indica TaxID=39946 RepID=B8BM92_ORYSI|nr:hypothetical protein OsI_38572 [Oryza sativa Indica Group]